MQEAKTYLKVVFKASYIAYVSTEEDTRGRRKNNFQKFANAILVTTVKKRTQQENTIGDNIGMQT